jgi:hypothetical protein
MVVKVPTHINVSVTGLLVWAAVRSEALYGVYPCNPFRVMNNYTYPVMAIIINAKPKRTQRLTKRTPFRQLLNWVFAHVLKTCLG